MYSRLYFKFMNFILYRVCYPFSWYLFCTLWLRPLILSVPATAIYTTLYWLRYTFLEWFYKQKWIITHYINFQSFMIKIKNEYSLKNKLEGFCQNDLQWFDFVGILSQLQIKHYSFRHYSLENSFHNINRVRALLNIWMLVLLIWNRVYFIFHLSPPPYAICCWTLNYKNTKQVNNKHDE